MRRIRYSAPGKIFLSGEHAVVYAKPALVTAIQNRLTFSLQSSQSEFRQLDKPIEAIYNVVLSYLKKSNISRSDENFEYQISSELPWRRGMGSSASLCVSAVSAFLHWHTGKTQDASTVNSLAHKAEHYFHGKSSGVDVSVATYGGLIYYRKEFEFLKNISSLYMKIPKDISDSLILIDSGKPKETTKEMVEHVGTLFQESPALVEKTLQEIEKCTRRLTLSIAQENADLFKETIQHNQDHLVSLGIVSSDTSSLLSTLEPYGVGKVTGAGGRKKGSGFILFYSNRISELKHHLEQEGISYHAFLPSDRGVSQETD